MCISTYRGTWYFLCPTYHTLLFDLNILEPAHLNAALVHKHSQQGASGNVLLRMVEPWLSGSLENLASNSEFTNHRLAIGNCQRLLSRVEQAMK